MPLKLPAVCFHREYALLLRRWDDLTVTTSHALKQGKLQDLLLVDSAGTALRVENARMLHGVGPLGGYDLFLNRKIAVELSFAGEPYQMSLADFKRRLRQSFREWEGWEAGSNFEELEEKVERATSFEEIFDQLFSTECA